jgi:hypothetical protein
LKVFHLQKKIGEMAGATVVLLLRKPALPPLAPEVKGKSAKKGVLSGFVPFVQILCCKNIKNMRHL